MSDAEIRELQDEITRLSEQLAEYRSVVGEVVETLGHVGNDPRDLADAVGQIEALFNGKDSLERDDLAGLAEQVRRVLHGSSFAEPSPCTHGVMFDSVAARGHPAHHIRMHWPRLYGVCPLGCGFDGIAYASKEHYVAGDW